MKRTRTIRSLPMAATAAIALLGLTAAGHAEQVDAVALTAASLTIQEGPVFVPNAAPGYAPNTAQGAPLTGTAPIADTASIADAEPAETSTALGSGSASYYADRFNGQRTASGERFNNAELTAAHRTLPFGSRVRVTNPRSGESVVVRINDRGPFSRDRMIDLSRAAAEQVGIVRAGHGQVALELIAN
jgi:rare lipoprotein A